MSEGGMDQSEWSRPWLPRYAAGDPATLQVEHADCVEMLRASVARRPEAPLVHYFERSFTAAEIDRLSDALGAGLVALGIEPADRVALYLQNCVQFPIAALAVWKAGATVVPVNPMLKERELGAQLADSGARAIVALGSLLTPPIVAAIDGAGVETVIVSDDGDYVEERFRSLVPTSSVPSAHGHRDFLRLIDEHLGQAVQARGRAGSEVAFLTYTSGTTGLPKGAMNLHRNVAFDAHVMRDWAALDDSEVIWGVAPLFHITGLVLQFALGLLTGCPLVLTYRFDPATALAMIEHHRATFSIGSITAYIALLNEPSAESRDLSSLTKVYSGGAPVPVATVEDFERRFGAYIHNAYGLTETTSAALLVPRDARAPVDAASGALSVGVPVFSTDAKVVDEGGDPVEPGQVGELVVSGPQVVPGYWRKDEETLAAFPEGWLRTGDIAFMDADGWFYIVDRKKDMIIASGYKVWPREVEDVLYGHPAVREAAVVGVPHAYRGETVKAFVSLRDGGSATEAELMEYCRARLAAYKYPRSVEILPDIPKTASGKILRRELRLPAG